MLSISTKEKLKNAALFSVLVIASFASAFGLGLDLFYVGYTAIIFVIRPSVFLLEYVRANTSSESESEEIAKDDQRKLSRFLGYFFLFWMGIPLAGSIAAYMRTADLLYSAAIFTLPMIMDTLFLTINKTTIILDQYSTSRPLNVANEQEAEFDNILKNLCHKTGVAVPSVTYCELFDKVNDQNFAQFREDMAKIDIPKKILNIESNAEFLEKIKSYFTPNMAASRTLFDGTHLHLYSSVINHSVKITPKEMEAMLAHELGHHAAYDSYKGVIGRGLYAMTVLLGFSSLRLIGLFLMGVAHIAYTQWHKSVETRADLYSAEKVGSEGLITAFDKIVAHKEAIKLLNAEENETLFTKAKDYYKQWSSSHPSGKDRIAVLKTFAAESKATAQSCQEVKKSAFVTA